MKTFIQIFSLFLQISAALVGEPPLVSAEFICVIYTRSGQTLRESAEIYQEAV
jgi:hypothetical protein